MIRRRTFFRSILPMLAGAPLAAALADNADRNRLPEELSPIPLDRELREFLRIHNEARQAVGVPSLRWSPSLAEYAQEWADHLASLGGRTLRHRSQDQYGENLFAGTAKYNFSDAARFWLAEIENYRGNPISFWNVSDVGHYTQMVWRETTEVGAASAQAENGWVVIVANYSPMGNFSGRTPY